MKAANVIRFFSVAAVVAVASAQAHATVVKFGTVAPANTPWADSLETLKKDIEKNSGGKIKVRTYLGGQLGGEQEILDKVRRGRVQGGGITSAALASAIPELDVLEIPYLFDSSEEADFVLDNYLYKPFQELFEKRGLVLVSWAENGWRDIGTKDKPVLTPADIKGLKVRSQESKTHLAFWNKVGANPVPIAITEVLPSLQTGLVEGFDNTPLFTLAAELHTAIKHYSTTGHIYQPAAIVYSKKFWDGLDADQKKVLMADGNGMAPTVRAGVRALGEELLTVMKESGVKVHKLSATQIKAFKESTKGMADSLVKQLGGESKRIYALIQEGKQAFAKQKK